jgi:D-sedoheptulose 7-phosphate isomerase
MSAGIPEILGQGIAVLQAVERDRALHTALARAAEQTAAALRSGHTLFIAGNGGSAADAQHLATEFVSRLVEDRAPMRALALTTDSSVLTAIANDYGFEHSFSRQIQALGRPGDVFLAISTSGRSSNILRALEACRAMGVATLGLTGSSGHGMASLCDIIFCVPSEVTAYIQQAHLALEHIFCMLVERAYFGQQQPDSAQTAVVAPA